MPIPPLSGLTNPLFAVVGYGVGTATGPVLRPFVQDLANFAWSEHRIRPLGVQDAAALWVEGTWTEARAKTEASYTGFSDSRIEALHELMDDPPALAYLFELWRRGLIGVDKFTEGLKHHRVEADYFGPLRQLRQVLLTPEMLAAARVKGHVTEARQYAESALQGIDNERAEIMYQTTGNPPGPETLIAMLNRAIIDGGGFHRGILQGNIRPEWEDEYLRLRHRLLTPGEIVNQHLRGWRSFAWMEERLADHGFNAEDALDLFQGQGRPISTRQVFIGQRRGGVYNGPAGGINPAILKQLQESNIRPEWYNLADAQKESYPSAFVIRQLATSGAIDPAQTRRVLMEIGWPEWLIDAVVTAWTSPVGETVAPEVKSAHTRAMTLIRNAYVANRATAADVATWRAGLDAAQTAADPLIATWDVLKLIPGAGLTRAQVKKAFKSLPLEWPRDRALTELEDLGMEPEEAQTYLDE